MSRIRAAVQITARYCYTNNIYILVDPLSREFPGRKPRRCVPRGNRTDKNDSRQPASYCKVPNFSIESSRVGRTADRSERFHLVPPAVIRTKLWQTFFATPTFPLNAIKIYSPPRIVFFFILSPLTPNNNY